jgi:hypothetical protein
VIYARENQLPREKMVILKFDLRKAYLLLSYSSASVSKVGVELRDNLFMFFISGVFGLTGIPMAFQVVTRAIVFEINRLIQEGVMQYVDDGVVCSHERCVTSKKAIVFNFLVLHLSPNTIVFEKFEIRCTIDFIGYSMSLQFNFVRPQTAESHLRLH